MKFITIFAHTLYSVEYEAADCKQLSIPSAECKYKGDELTRLKEKWSDVGYLRNFYSENAKLFCTDFWKGVSKEDFVSGIIESTPHILCEIKQICSAGTIDSIFKPLDNRQYKTSQIRLLEVKATHGKIKGRLALRIYAICLERGCYLITGSAIKITEKMADHPLTVLEIEKIDYVKTHLCNNGVFDVDSFEDYKK